MMGFQTCGRPLENLSLTSYFGTHAEYLMNEEQNGVATSLSKVEVDRRSSGSRAKGKGT